MTPELETEFVDIKRQDGSHAKICFIEPANVNKSHAILCFPAMGVSASYYRPFIEELARHGYPAGVTDLRGHGYCSIRPSRSVDYGYKEMVTIDYPAAINRFQDLFPDRSIILLGHSLGGQLASLYLASNPGRAQGLILIASCSNDYRNWPFPWKLPVLVGSQLAGMIARKIGYFPGKSLKFAGTESRSVILDWARQARTGQYFLKKDNLSFESTMSTINIPVFAISLENDLFAPAAAVDALCGKLSKANIDRFHFRSSRYNYNHFNWAKKSTPLVEAIHNWETKQILQE